MKQFLSKIWNGINSPIADIIAGSFMILGGILACYYLSEWNCPCIYAFVGGCLITMGFDCVDHGFDRRRKSSGSPDDDNNKNESE